MGAVILKELRQCHHNRTAVITIGVLVFLEVLAFLCLSAPSLMNSFEAYKQLAVLALGSGWVGGMFLLTQAATRWRLERGDASLDIVATTPIPAWKICLEKWTAAWLSALTPTLVLFPLFPALHVSGGEMGNIILATLTGNAALGSLLLGLGGITPAIRGKKFDWASLAVLFLIMPIFALAAFTLADPPQNVRFFLALLGAATVALFGFAIMIAAAEPANANRLLPLKSGLVLNALLFPGIATGIDREFPRLVDQRPYTILFFLTACVFLILASCERTVQSRRVLTELSPLNPARLPKLLLSTGAVNSIALGVLCMAGSVFCSENFPVVLMSKFALLLFYTGLTLRIRHRAELRDAHLPGFLILILLAAIFTLPSLFYLWKVDGYYEILSPICSVSKINHPVYWITLTLAGLALASPEFRRNYRQWRDRT